MFYVFNIYIPKGNIINMQDMNKQKSLSLLLLLIMMPFFYYAVELSEKYVFVVVPFDPYTGMVFSGIAVGLAGNPAFRFDGSERYNRAYWRHLKHFTGRMLDTYWLYVSELETWIKRHKKINKALKHSDMTMPPVF